MARSEELRNILTEVLTSPQFITAISDVISNRDSPGNNQSASNPCTIPNTQTSDCTANVIARSNAQGRQSLISTRLHEMFPSITPTRSASQRTNFTRTTTRTTGASFDRDVILVKSKLRNETLKRGEKHDAFRDGYAKQGVKFYTKWDFDNIVNHLKDIFSDKLNNNEFDILIPNSGFLTIPVLNQDEQLNGAKLKRLSQQKAIYIRPHSNLHDCGPTESALTLSPDTSPVRSPNISPFFLNYEENDFLSTFSALASRINRDSTTPTYFNIDRNNIFNGCKRGLKRANFNPFNRISVQFVDVDNVSEGAIDGGGPTLEMFRLLLLHLQSSCLFSGTDNSKNITYCAEQLHDNNYFYAGQIIGLSLIHGSCGPKFLSETLFQFLVSGVEGMNPNLEDLQDIKVKNIVQRISSSENVAEIQEIILEEDMILVAGWSIISSLEQRKDMISDILKFHVSFRARPALEQFLSGMKTCCIDDLIRQFPTDMKKLLCYVPNNLTFSKIKELFIPVLSPQGSNLRLLENRVLVDYYDFLADCEANDSEITLREILIFATGCDNVPPLGFKYTPTIEFLHGSTKIYPEASTCSIVLKLPVVHTEYNNFKASMTFGIQNGAVFGLE